MNDVYGEREERGFLRKTATSLAFTIGGVACLLVAVGAMPIVFTQLGLESAFDLSPRSRTGRSFLPASWSPSRCSIDMGPTETPRNGVG